MESIQKTIYCIISIYIGATMFRDCVSCHDLPYIRSKTVTPNIFHIFFRLNIRIFALRELFQYPQ